MPAFLAEFLKQMRGIWSRLDGAQRLTMGVVLLATIAGLSAVVWFAGRPDYQVVFTTDDPKAFGEATTVLTQAGVPFKEEGHAVLVESGRMREAQGKLFKAGVTGLRGPETDSALSSLTLDAEAKKFQLAKASWAHAEFAVRQIDGVLAVNVVASQPKRSPFQALDKQNQPRANVVVTIRSGTAFEAIARAAVAAVASATSIPEECVTVTDAKTARRFQVDGDHGSGADVGEFMGLERKRSAELTERAQALLDRLYPNQAQVLVTAQLVPQWEIRTEKIVSETPLLKEDKTDKKDSKDGNGGTVGDPSTTAIASGTSTAPGAAANASTSKIETKTKSYYDPVIGERRSGLLAPELKRLSVALALDEALKPDAKKTTDITALVKQAIGWDDQRDGQSFAIHVDKFAPVQELIGVSAPSLLDRAIEWGPAAGQGLAVLVVLLFLRSLLKKSRLAKEEGPVPLTQEQKETLAPEEQARRMRREIERSIAEDPAAISRLLESWREEQKS